MATRKDVRASDAERDAAAAALQEHFVQGRLTLDELQERLDSAMAAKTHGHLDEIFADMPRLPQPVVTESAEPPVFPARLRTRGQGALLRPLDPSEAPVPIAEADGEVVDRRDAPDEPQILVDEPQPGPVAGRGIR